MKNRNCVNVILLLVSLLALAGCDYMKPEREVSGLEHGAKSTLSLVLTLDKTIYTSSEKIEASVLLKNIGIDYLTVNARMAPIFLPDPDSRSGIGGEILFVIESPSGNRVSTKGNWRIREIVESDFIVLSPRMGIQYSYNIREDYNLDELGTYSIFVTYQNQLDLQKGSSTWTGELTSNTVNFEITP